jgi:hypothetical protein
VEKNWWELRYAAGFESCLPLRFGVGHEMSRGLERVGTQPNQQPVAGQFSHFLVRGLTCK